MREPLSPPAWAEAVLRAILPAADVESVSGDLLEVYRDEQRPARGRAGADRWYLRQVARTFARAYWCWIAPLIVLFTASDVMNTWRLLPSQGPVVPGAGLALVTAAALHGGWRSRRVAGGLLAGAGSATTLWLFMATWWMATWYPLSAVQVTEPYWIDAWRYSSAPGETFRHWIFWDNVGAIVMSGLVLNTAGGLVGLAGGLLGSRARKIRHEP
jgi:hypothetical protein